MPQTTEHHHAPASNCARRAARTAPSERSAGPLHLVGWRYYGLDDVLYERRTLLVGGPIVMLITAFASALGNRRRRQEAERDAAPQWRPLGPVAVEVRDDRLLVRRDGEPPGTVWLASVVDVRVHAEHGIVDLFFEHDAPFRFQGADAAHLAAALTGSCLVPA